MSYGLEFTNSSGHVAIDGNNKHYKIYTSGTIKTQLNSYYGIPITVPDKGAIIMFRTRVYSSSIVFGAMTTETSTGLSCIFVARNKGLINSLEVFVEYIVYIPVKTVDIQNTGYGLTINNKFGVPIFSSGISKTLPIKHSATITAKFTNTTYPNIVPASLVFTPSASSTNYALASSVNANWSFYPARKGVGGVKRNAVTGALEGGTTKGFYSYVGVIFHSNTKIEYIVGDVVYEIQQYWRGFVFKINCMIGINR